MTEPTKPNDPPEAEPSEGMSPEDLPPESVPGRNPGGDDLRSLLRTALTKEEPEPLDVLSGVQAKLRERSRGKFYGDGWSTSKAPPISTYLITSLVMLAVVIVVYAILAPLSGDPADMDTTPKPVHIVPSPQK